MSVRTYERCYRDKYVRTEPTAHEYATPGQQYHQLYRSSGCVMIPLTCEVERSRNKIAPIEATWDLEDLDLAEYRWQRLGAQEHGL